MWSLDISKIFIGEKDLLLAIREIGYGLLEMTKPLATWKTSRRCWVFFKSDLRRSWDCLLGQDVWIISITLAGGLVLWAILGSSEKRYLCPLGNDVGVLPWPAILNVILGNSISRSYGLSLYDRNSTCWDPSSMDLLLRELAKRRKAHSWSRPWFDISIHWKLYVFRPNSLAKENVSDSSWMVRASFVPHWQAFLEVGFMSIPL